MLDAGRRLFGLTYEHVVGSPVRHFGLRTANEVLGQFQYEPFNWMAEFVYPLGPYELVRLLIRSLSSRFKDNVGPFPSALKS